MPSLPLVVLATAHDLALRCGIDEPSAISHTAEAWADHPDPLWRTVAHHRCVDQRRAESGRTGPDHRPVAVLDDPDWLEQGGANDPGMAEAETRCDLASALGGLTDEDLARLARHFWLGIPVKTPRGAVELARSIRHAKQTATRVPPRVITVLSWASQGHTNEQIAHRMGLSTNTIKTHMSRALRILGADDRAHAVAIALRSGLIT